MAFAVIALALRADAGDDACVWHHGVEGRIEVADEVRETVPVGVSREIRRRIRRSAPADLEGIGQAVAVAVGAGGQRATRGEVDVDIAVVPGFRIGGRQSLGVALIDIDEAIVVVVAVVEAGGVDDLAEDDGGVAGVFGGSGAAEDGFGLDVVTARGRDGPGVAPRPNISAGRGGWAVGEGDTRESGRVGDVGAGFHFYLKSRCVRPRAVPQGNFKRATIRTGDGRTGDANERFGAGIDDDAADGGVLFGRVVRVLVDDAKLLLEESRVVDVGQGDRELVKGVAGAEVAIVDRPAGAVLGVVGGGEGEAGLHLLLGDGDVA